jgi:hypothetical protein
MVRPAYFQCDSAGRASLLLCMIMAMACGEDAGKGGPIGLEEGGDASSVDADASNSETDSSECAPELQIMTCAACGSDALYLATCAAGSWRCPAGTVDAVKECPVGTCYGFSTCCNGDGGRKSKICPAPTGGVLPTPASGRCPDGYTECSAGTDAGGGSDAAGVRSDADATSFDAVAD